MHLQLFIQVAGCYKMTGNTCKVAVTLPSQVHKCVMLQLNSTVATHITKYRKKRTCNVYCPKFRLIFAYVCLASITLKLSLVTICMQLMQCELMFYLYFVHYTFRSATGCMNLVRYISIAKFYQHLMAFSHCLASCSIVYDS